MNLGAPISNIPRISLSYQKRLVKLGVKTLRDLFYHFPHRYDDFSKIISISELKLNEIATVQGKVIAIKNIRAWRKKIMVTEAYVQDATGTIKVVWFNQPYLINALKENSIVSLSGKIYFDKESYFSNPAYEKIFSTPADFARRGPERRPARLVPPLAGRAAGLAWVVESKGSAEQNPAQKQLRHTGRLVPVYPETAGLSSRYLRYLIKIFLPAIEQIKDWLPEEIKKSQRLPSLADALKKIHFPASWSDINQAKKRLAFDEIFIIQLFALRQKLLWRQKHSLKIPFNEKLIKNFISQLPFGLTLAQKKAAWEILQDLDKNRPMNRLLEGDVGSGKTVVAALAILGIIEAKLQTAIMAPTEILARQHFKTVSHLFKNYSCRIGLLVSGEARIFIGGFPKIKPAEKIKKTEMIARIKKGEINLVIGTHALIQKEVNFKNLALVIVDEQHRFGVAQRAALQKNVIIMEDGLPQKIPHLLTMTATPIPRTLALTVYGDLDISILDEMPAGRQKIITKIVAPANRLQSYEFIRAQIKARGQVFVICPRIEISDKSSVISDQKEKLNTNHLSLITLRNWDDVKAVKEEYEKLSQKIFPDLKIGLLHGQLKSKEKEKVMNDFTQGKIDILVATSVVEVGIDMPNATIMMIEGADRFGLAQLHQFRGRVGRGPRQSYCLLFTESSSQSTQARLKALVNCANGFELAQKDLELRGPGEFFGAHQWGLPDLSMASLTDVELIKSARQSAVQILQQNPKLEKYPVLRQKLKEFSDKAHLE